MDKITPRLPFAKPQAARSEREELVQSILDKINKGRVGTSYKPLHFLALQKMLAGRTKSDLYVLIASCDEAELDYKRSNKEKGAPWSAAFFATLKRQKQQS